MINLLIDARSRLSWDTSVVGKNNELRLNTFVNKEMGMELYLCVLKIESFFEASSAEVVVVFGRRVRRRSREGRGS